MCKFALIRIGFFSIFFIFLTKFTFCYSLERKIDIFHVKSSQKWMLDQIAKDLGTFKSNGITESLLSQTINEMNKDDRCRFKIISGQVIMEIETLSSLMLFRAIILNNAFNRLAREYSLPDLDFICCLKDSVMINNLSPFPIFSFAKKFNEPYILFPDSDALSGCYKYFDKIDKRVLWKDKLNKGFWRGSTSDGDYSSKDFLTKPRYLIVLLSIQFPDIVDARFTNLVQGAESNPEILSSPFLLGNHVSTYESSKYKYLIDVDGNTCGYSRCYWTLLSNSAVFKQVTDNMQWYYGAIEPYKHYIPVKKDFSDLIEKILWARSHDDKIKKISKNATKFVQNNLNEEDIYLYLYLLLTEYAKLQRFQPHI